jgi:UDP-N-acetylmuramoyl-L-alanyl-D-glutamate--2,6-diaminopimelate ligase
MKTLSSDYFSKIQAMNNPLLSKLGEKGFHFSSFTGVTEDIQYALQSEIGIYSLKNADERSLNVFKSRVQASCAKCIILFTEIQLPIEDQRVIKFALAEKKTILNELLDYFYPKRKNLQIIGVTGTNGKTSVAYFIFQIMNMIGRKSSYVGTIGIIDSQFNERKINNTMPGHVEMRRTFDTHKDSEYFVVEATSIGLIQERLGDFKLDLAIWTNFTQDHLDYHKDMGNYFLAKLKIAEYLKDNSKLLLLKSQKKLKEMIVSERPILADKLVSIEDSAYDKEIAHTEFSMGFMHDNLVLALATIENLIQVKPSSKVLSLLKSPPGRFQVLSFKDSTSKAVIDYAHTPDALENLIKAARSQFAHYKLVLVFGCGGNRDRLKRPLMGKIGEKLCDGLIITSDNPRFEEPEEIIQEILNGIVAKDRVQVEVDREKAIQLAILIGKKQPAVIIIAGKGHETGQEIKGKVFPFSDHELVAKLIS